MTTHYGYTRDNWGIEVLGDHAIRTTQYHDEEEAITEEYAHSEAHFATFLLVTPNTK